MPQNKLPIGHEYLNVKKRRWYVMTDTGYRKRAVVNMEKKLGEPIPAGMIVHHKDENSENDEPDNLELKPSQAEHARQHSRKLSDEAILDIRANCKPRTQKDYTHFANKYHVSYEHVARVLKGKFWSEVSTKR